MKPIVFLVGLYPLGRWIVLAWQQELTANPTEFLTRSSGTWTLVFLIIALCVTPMRFWLDQPALIRLRRMCGLFAFFYATLHMLAWAWWDQGLVWQDMLRDTYTRPFVTVGVVAFVVLLLMAMTSSQKAMRMMGRGWKRLHRMVYLVAVLVIVHFWLHKAGKNDFSEVAIYGLVMAGLLLWRFWRHIKPEKGIGQARRSG